MGIMLYFKPVIEERDNGYLRSFYVTKYVGRLSNGVSSKSAKVSSILTKMTDKFKSLGITLN